MNQKLQYRAPATEKSLSEPIIPRTEAEYLDLQAEKARAAMRQSMADIQECADNLRATEWIRERPWISTGISSGIGFVVGSLLTRSRRGAVTRVAERRDRDNGGGVMAMAGSVVLKPMIEILQALLASIPLAMMVKPPDPADTGIPPTPTGESAPTEPTA